MRGVIGRHLRRHLVVYLPAVAPLFFFLLTHGIAMLMLILIRSGMLSPGLTLHKTLLTWGVYGFLPLLCCSYGCFFAVARPVAKGLERRFSQWMPGMLTLASGAAYGVAVTLVLLLLLPPDSMLRICLLSFVGLATGLGNWLLYRTLTGAFAQTAQPPQTDES
ncbi:MAG: hypothetical protein FWD79_09980 [Desulfobulbus sp.]|nr:hypothetical protein [Desulfobulbus sp.]